VVMLVRKLDIQPHLHSVHITTELHGEVFSLQHYMTTVEKAKLDIERFVNSTHHIRDRVKHIHFPQRVIPGSVRTHDYNPFRRFKR
jgi:hypothetical protein